MPARKRSELVAPNEVGVYFCWSRCVRRMKSGTGGSGQDTCGPLTENPARHHWFDRRLEALASVFAIELNEYSVLDHTVNTLLTLRPDIAAQWSDEEVVRRWAKLSRKQLDLVEEELSDEDFQERVNDPKYVADKRKRLSDLSWFMIELKEPISLAANAEDGASGHGFAERFGCERLYTQDAILQVTAEIAAQAVSSGLAESPESAERTSYHDRLEDDRTWTSVEAEEDPYNANQEAGRTVRDEERDESEASCRSDLQVESLVGARSEISTDAPDGAHSHDVLRRCQGQLTRCRRRSRSSSVWRPKAGWMTPGGSEGDGYDGVAAGRRVTNESHLTIERDVLDELLKKWCQQEKDAAGLRVSIPAELPEELARRGFDPVCWAEAYRRTARRFDRLARKAAGMRRDFERVWNGGRGSAEGNRNGYSANGGAIVSQTSRVHEDAKNKVEERSG